MRNLLLTLAMVLAVAAAVGLGVYRACCDPATHAAARDGDALFWLRTEFRLNDVQYAEVARLHEEHSAVCAGHCAAVRAAKAMLGKLNSAGAPADQRAAAAARLQLAENNCRVSVEAHVRRVAAVMERQQGERYLAMVLPRLSALDHSGPPNARLDH